MHTPGDKRCEDVIKWPGFDGQKNAENNARFIAALNPVVVQALLDEREAQSKRIAEQETNLAALAVENVGGFAPIFPDTCYHLTHYWPAAADIPVASDNPVHYADAIRYNAR
ncbi:ead/Ea22-like family protein, partial [Escherichia coli]|nr:ead/Ea22-like family protein [Escherichia coli]NJQ33609.1 ead/Ea22-like family protein [Escherichia coli]NJQ47348.1 ead/Ea22-like family protein [Escherichia coli]